MEDYWLGRPVWAGMCTWHDLKTNMTMADLLNMHRSLNLKAYLEEKSAEAIKE